MKLSKIKINLTNGTIIEKPLVTAFKGNYGTYMVLDDERTGNMGLPVILVSKIQDNKVSSIIDPNEWNAVKDNLRNLINGIQAEYITPAQEFSADENYCSQLTLPVDYFDTLKNNYKPVGGVDMAQNVAPVEQAPVAPEPVIEPAVAPVNPEAVAAPYTPEAPEIQMPEVGPTMVEPPVAPVVEPPVEAAPQMPEPPQAPSVEPIPTPQAPAEPAIDFSQDKEAFLKACENMFDALVSKFNK